ncbi:hypothetical protein DAKH74_024000 [Maudiozyma humilis]|uniref:Uncharacterized protein n=1 Tax=Maudiozyma humilis TaxID=51915 RepID=A0AAV5RVX6_MAUHU|nr:hypothetical protein DAKH74_024000 [Kazachstania humilis]
MKESSEQYWASNMKAGGLYTKDICDLCVSPERRVSVKPTPSEVEKSHPTNHEGQRSVDTSVEEESDAAPLDNTKPHVVIGGEQGPHQSTDVASRDSQRLQSLWENDEEKDSRISKLEAIIAQIIGKIPGLRLETKKEVVLQEGEGVDEVSTPGTKQFDDSTDVSIIDTSRECEKNDTARLTEMLKSQATIIEEMRAENAEARAASQQKFASMELKIETLEERVNVQAAEIDILKQEQVDSASLTAKSMESHKADLVSARGRVDELEEKVIEVASTVDNFSGDAVSALLCANSLTNRVSECESHLNKVNDLNAVQNKDIDSIRGSLDLKTEELEETKTLCEWQHNELRQVKTFLAAQDNDINTFKNAIASHGETMEALKKTVDSDSRDLHTALSSQKEDIKSIMDFIQTLRTQYEEAATRNREHQQSWNSSDTAESQDSLDSQLYYRFDKTFGATEEIKREQTHKATVSTSDNAETGSIQYLEEELGCASVQEGVFPTETSDQSLTPQSTAIFLPSLSPNLSST